MIKEYILAFVLALNAISIVASLIYTLYELYFYLRMRRA